MEGIKVDGNSLAIGACAGALLGGVLVFVVCRRSFNAKLDNEVAAVKRHYQIRAEAAAAESDNPAELPVPALAERLGYPREHLVDASDRVLSPIEVAVALEGLEDDDDLEVGLEPAVPVEHIPDDAPWPPADRDRRYAYLISSEEFAEGTEEVHQQLTITWYEKDRTLVDDQEKPLRDSNRYIGPISKEGFGGISGQPFIRYVRNERLQIDFEICYDERAYVDAVLNYGTPNKSG